MQTESRTYHLKIDAFGRLTLPAEVRSRHQIAGEQKIVMTDDAFGLRMRTQTEVIAEAQAYFKTIAPADVLLSEEIHADRRAEAARE